MDSLVTAGTITQVQENAILTAMTPPKDDSNRGPNNGGPATALDALVTAGTITKAQKTAILAAKTLGRRDHLLHWAVCSSTPGS